jgi:hypothetical protein
MDLLHSTLDTIGQAGDALDKFTGGRALRGVLGGKGREALSVLPFSDTLGLTDAKDKTSGRDLTDRYGLTSKGDNSFGSHAAGFLADNVLSPGNMLGAYGAFKAAPTIAKGLTSGAKALSGLDILDHVRSGSKALFGKFTGKNSDLLDGGLSSATSHFDALHPAPDGYFDQPQYNPNYQSSQFTPNKDLMSAFEDEVGAGVNELVHSDLNVKSINDMFKKHFGNEADSYKKMVGSGTPHLNDMHSNDPVSSPEIDSIASDGSPVGNAVRDSRNAIKHASSSFATNPVEQDLAARFIHAPDFHSAKDPEQLASNFAAKLERGRLGASNYFSPMYYDINQTLRGFDGDISPVISKIRSAKDFHNIDFSDIPRANLANSNSGFIPDPAMIDKFNAAHKWYTPQEYIYANTQFPKVAPQAFKKIFGDEWEKYYDHFKLAGENEMQNGTHVASTHGRGGDIYESISGLMDLLDHSRTPSKMDLFRGIDYKGVKKIEELIGAPLSSPQAVGRQFTDNGFLSTAYNRNVSDAFSGLTPGYNRPQSGAVFHFPEVPAGKQASFMNSSESEVLFPPGRKIRIDDNSDYPNSIRATLAARLPGSNAPIKSGYLPSFHDDLLSRMGREHEPWFQAMQAAEHEGIPISLISGKTWADKGFNADELAHYQANQGLIRLNVDHHTSDGPLWLDPKVMQAMLDNNVNRHFSSSHPGAIIDHELAHAFHHQSVGDDLFSKLSTMGRFDGKANRLVTNRVSSYAKENPLEFVAETYAGLKGGKDYRDAPDVGKWFRDYAGTPFLDRIANSGLGRGVGLSLLGAYGYNSMNNHSEA